MWVSCYSLEVTKGKAIKQDDGWSLKVSLCLQSHEMAAFF